MLKKTAILSSQPTLFSLPSLSTVSSASQTSQKPFSSTNSWKYPLLTHPQLLQQPTPFTVSSPDFSSLFSSSNKRQRFLPLVRSQPPSFPPLSSSRPPILAIHRCHVRWSAPLPLLLLLVLLYAVTLFIHEQRT